MFLGSLFIAFYSLRGCPKFGENYSGHIIERWLSDNNMNKIYASADDAINQIVRAN
jgi:hypothetical protein